LLLLRLHLLLLLLLPPHRSCSASVRRLVGASGATRCWC
jgi:hypothetical protein